MGRTRADWLPELWVSVGSYFSPVIVACLLLLSGQSGLRVVVFASSQLLVAIAGVKCARLPGCVLVAAIACVLGIVSSAGICLMCSDNELFCVGAYITALSFFHFSEYFTTAMWNPHRLSLDSFILNHSRVIVYSVYHIAVVASSIEYGLESWLFPQMKLFSIFSRVGLVLVVCGQLFRQLAMFKARSNTNILEPTSDFLLLDENYGE